MTGSGDEAIQTYFLAPGLLRGARHRSALRAGAHWDDYLRALDYLFAADDETLIDRLVITGHASTPGDNDPAYPIEGRRLACLAIK
jgi:hypothetical protein